MAQLLVSSVLNKLGEYLLQEAHLLHGVRDEIEWMEGEFRAMLCFLEEADSRRQANDEGLKNWVREIRDVAYEAEDAIEEFMVNLNQPASTAKIHRYASTFTSLVPRHRIGKKIRKIKARISDISARRATYDVANLGPRPREGTSAVDENLQACRRLSPHHYDEASIIGFHRGKKDIIRQLLNPQEQRRCVISIVGMGGLGKTTLAKKVYYSSEVNDHFIVRVWVSVSQKYRVSELLRKIIKEIIGTDDRENLDEEELKKELHELLMFRGRYLIVMDDVWSKEVWRRIETALPDLGNGSRVVFTTRLEAIAKFADPISSPHIMCFLNGAESRRLFLKKVYPNENYETFPDEELKDVGQKLVDRCCGLPLALVVLGGLLSTKEKYSYEWSRVLNSSHWQSTEEGKECLAILALSYENLPHNLKSCFLYLGSFPEDTHVNVGRLIRLWMAEGFIPQRRHEIREETARDFLHELVQRCMVQVVDRKYNWSIKRIQIHDLLRDLCLEEAANNQFLDAGSHHTDVPTISSHVTARRLTLCNQMDCGYMDLLTGKLKAANLRTLLGFNITGVEHMIGRPFYGLKLLRVIDIQFHYEKIDWPLAVTMLPKEIMTMVHLRYLRWIRSTPGPVACQSSLKDLCNLQTLDIRLLDRGSDSGIGSLKNLQTLKSVRAGRWIQSSLAKLTNLQKLSIKDIKESQAKGLVRSLSQLLCLVSLSLRSEESIPTEVLNILANHRRLCWLNLDGELSMRQHLPCATNFPNNLTKLILKRSRLEQDPLPVLEKLPNLLCLQLYDAYHGEMMVCSSGGFPRLKQMILNFLPSLRDWRMEVGTMPGLTHLIIIRCHELKKLPEGLQHVNTLKEFILAFMPRELKEKVQKGGDDWYKLQHVSSIIIR